LCLRSHPQTLILNPKGLIPQPVRAYSSTRKVLFLNPKNLIPQPERSYSSPERSSSSTQKVLFLHLRTHPEMDPSYDPTHPNPIHDNDPTPAGVVIARVVITTSALRPEARACAWPVCGTAVCGTAVCGTAVCGTAVCGTAETSPLSSKAVAPHPLPSPKRCNPFGLHSNPRYNLWYNPSDSSRQGAVQGAVRSR
jgi:hypothetical protein